MLKPIKTRGRQIPVVTAGNQCDRRSVTTSQIGVAANSKISDPQFVNRPMRIKPLVEPAERIRPKSKTVLDIQSTIKKAREEGKYERLLMQLSLRDKKIIELIETNPILSLMEVVRALELKHENSIYQLLKKLKRWETTGEIRKGLGRIVKGKCIARVREIVNGRLSQGETLEEIEAKAKLNSTERKVLEQYILPEERKGISKVAEETGIKRVTISLTVRKIENKLLGRKSSYHLELKYRKMSDDELLKAIKNIEAISLSELHVKNQALKVVARERGIINSIYPNKGKMQKKIENVIFARIADGVLEEYLLLMTNPEKEVTEAIRDGTYKSKTKSIRDKYELNKSYGVALIASSVNVILEESLGKHEILRRIRAIVRKLGEEKMIAIADKINNREKILLKERVLTDKVKTLEEVSEMEDFSIGGHKVTRERVRQKEVELFGKLEFYLESGFWNLKGLIVELQETGKLGNIMTRLELSPLELAVIERIEGKNTLTDRTLSVRYRTHDPEMILTERKLIREILLILGQK
ncbi:MAG: hypothetical protein Q7S22_00180 [Candidatus Micrarchaeota archaeon]|nr:hypothetical protein [Candidatus Micrarchaeota archaeon]